MDKNLEKLEDDQERARVLRERSSASTLERPRQGSNAPAFARERSRSIVVRSSAPVREAQSSRNPVLEVLVLGFWLILVAQ
jgi:hypothetical protein